MPPGKCIVSNLVYKANVTGNNTVEKYEGLTANTFNERYGGHKGDFKNPGKRTSSTLAGHI